MRTDARAQDVVVEALARAADILRRMPMPRHGRPGAPRALWPEWLRETALVDRVGMVAEGGRGGVTIEEIAHAERWVEASLNLSDIERRVVWARAFRVTWRALTFRLHRSDTHLQGVWRRAIAKLSSSR